MVCRNLKRTDLAVLERTSVQTHSSVGKERLHLGDEQVALLEECPHLKLIRLEFSSL